MLKISQCDYAIARSSLLKYSVRQITIVAVILLSTVTIFHLMPTRFKGKDATTGKYKYQLVSVKGTKKDTEKRLSELLNQLDNRTFIKLSKVTLAEYFGEAA